jgi:hypothetical protein
MPTVSQRCHIVGTHAHDHTCVCCYLRMQAEKVAAMKRHHGSTPSCCNESTDATTLQ